MPVLTIDHLSKSYGRIQALKDVSFSVPEGSVFGILGPNGSGKTTLLGTIMDVLNPPRALTVFSMKWPLNIIAGK